MQDLQVLFVSWRRIAYQRQASSPVLLRTSQPCCAPAGTKLQKIVNSAAGGSTITDLDGIEEHRGGDVFVYHPEGRYAQYADDPDYPNWRLEYSLRDHLGNNRVMISDLNGDGYIQLSASDWVGNIPYLAPEIIQEEQYYPFGMAMEGVRFEPYWAKKDAYGYNGKELNEDIGLGWHDYGARWYDASIGRWGQVDPLADKVPEWVPYRYAFNNPLIFIDPDGLFETKDEAKKYAKDNGIKTGLIGGLVSGNKIVEQEDGTFAIRSFRSMGDDFRMKAEVLIFDGGTVDDGTAEGFDIGVVAAVTVRPGDIMSVNHEGGFTETVSRTETYRDGTNRTVTPETGSPPVGPGRYRSILRALRTFDKYKQVFRNDKRRLPTKTESGEPIKYEKVDVDRAPTDAQRANGAKRSKRRLIRGSDGSYYYTHDHYETFKRIKVPNQ